MSIVEVQKHTGVEEARRAIEATCREPLISKASLNQIYTWLHSPIRTQLFEIYIQDIPSFVAGHLVRHVTAVPFVKTSRLDRGGTEDMGRYTPVDMRIWANAESLISMAGKRLCYKSSPETVLVMSQTIGAISAVDPELARHMVPNCVLQGGYCREPKPCGYYKVKRYDPQKILKSITV